MKSRWLKFILMLTIVVALGTGTTILNLRWQEKSRDVSVAQMASETGRAAESIQKVFSESNSDTGERYYARLQDMERVYESRMNATMKDSLAVQQHTIEELLEIWDEELNVIYQKLRNKLSYEEFAILRNEERAWLRDRDAAANQAAIKDNYSKSTQNLAYVRSLLQWTRERVYELADMYYGG